MKLAELLDIDLKKIDREMTWMIKADLDLPMFFGIAGNIIHMIEAGGKRLRPMMVIVGSRFGRITDPKLVLRLAAVTEFIHVASLIHDDVIDKAETRRGQPTLHVKTDVQTAVYTANYMMARVVELLAAQEQEQEDNSYLKELSGLLTSQLCLGEYQQMNNRFNFDLPMETYLSKTRNKTAILMSSCLEVGAKLAKADEEVVCKLSQFGDHLGMAFQIRDDMLDFIQTSAVLGKPAGSDLANGNITLPVLYALQDERLAPKVRRLNDNSTQEEIGQVVSDIVNSKILHMVDKTAEEYLSAARKIAEELVDFRASKDLEILLAYFGKRVF
ncbi:polyprenyl synthetase family protein [Brevibacillus daliensis]|uniref:polyprenyl synthetase family protein n=1 Tax=Brevibacillus daliensis TaxID=2892995 RepID=UPI001E602B1B|nr:polyprenyl synthetase family protein [Brevibacillus daliensis]